jgi:hypothetical protein
LRSINAPSMSRKGYNDRHDEPFEAAAHAA